MRPKGVVDTNTDARASLGTRTTSITGKRPAQQESPEGEPAPEKKIMRGLVSRFESTTPSQLASSVGTGQAVAFKTGREFADHIRSMATGSDAGVRTSVTLKVGQDGTGEKTHPFTIGASFSVDTHPTTGLTQGMMDSSGWSAYAALDKSKNIVEEHSVLPSNLSLHRARLEGRVIKALSDNDYRPGDKLSVHPEMQFTQKKTIAQSTMGTIALGSYLEDVTASRAVGLGDVGSAMRATLMAAKWNMTVDGNEEAGKGFRATTMSAFPQLGKGGYAIGDLTHSGISALNEHWQKGGTLFSVQQQIDNVRAAHVAANQAAGRVFDWKFGRSDEEIAQGGKWWTDNREHIAAIKADHASDEPTRVESALKRFDALTQNYKTRKFGRHGINE